MEEKILKIEGMHCNSCVLLLTDAISEVKGVAGVKIDLKSKEAKVSVPDESVLAQVKSVIRNEGYKVV